MVPRLQEFKGIASSKNGWDLLMDSKADDLIIETKQSIRGFQIMRAYGTLDFRPIDVARCSLC